MTSSSAPAPRRSSRRVPSSRTRPRPCSTSSTSAWVTDSKRPSDFCAAIPRLPAAKTAVDKFMSFRHRPAIPDLADLARGIRAHERAIIARAITLIESRRADHQKAARRLVQDLLPSTGKAIRVGITGAPGVGKSTTIDALGTFLTGKGHKVAVLAVDPSYARSGGSILADKTRMPPLARDRNAYIRPSPSAGTPGRVAVTNPGMM